MNRNLVCGVATVLLWVGSAWPGGAVDPCDVVIAIAPKHPDVAWLASQTGDVMVTVLLDGNGDVATVKDVDGPVYLQAAARLAATRWKFRTGENGRSRELVFAFRLLPKGSHSTLQVTTFQAPNRVEILTLPPESDVQYATPGSDTP